jgi:hypothetical protein
MDDDDDKRAKIGGMRIGRENRSTTRNPDPGPLCQKEISYDLSWS